MRDKFSLGSALQDRFSWSVTPSPPTAERKIFDTACEKWDKWERAQLLASLQPGRTSTRSHESKHHPILNNSLASPAILHFSENNDHNPNKIGQDKKKRRASTSSSSALLPPTRRLSRAMRVFVAWKAWGLPREQTMCQTQVGETIGLLAVMDQQSPNITAGFGNPVALDSFSLSLVPATLFDISFNIIFDLMDVCLTANWKIWTCGHPFLWISLVFFQPGAVFTSCR